MQNATQANTMNVFDRKAKKMQRDRSASSSDYLVYNYLKDEVKYCWKMSLLQEQMLSFLGGLQAIRQSV